MTASAEGTSWKARIATLALAVAVAYNAVVTEDFKLAGVPLKAYLLITCMLAWAIHRRPWREVRERPRLTLPVLTVALGVPVLWFAVAIVRHRAGDPAQKVGLSYAVTEASHFLYLLLFFPLVDYLRRQPGSIRHRIWMRPTLFTCAISLVIWLGWALAGFDYGGHQFRLLRGAVGLGPGGYRVALVTQLMLLPALAITIGTVATSRLTRESGRTIFLLLATAVASQTRGYWLGLLVATGVLIALTIGWPRRRRARLAVLCGLLCVLAASQVAVGTGGPGTSSSSQISISQRLQTARELLHGADSHLLVGSGLGATLPDGYVRSTSNPWSFELTYYQLLFELGVIGLIAVVWLPLTVMWRCWRRLDRLAREPANQARIAIAGMLAIVVADSTNPYLINSVGMLAVAILAAIGELALDGAHTGEEPATSKLGETLPPDGIEKDNWSLPRGTARAGTTS